MPTEPDDPEMTVEAAAQRIQQAYNDECGECGSRLDLTDALILARAALLKGQSDPAKKLAAAFEDLIELASTTFDSFDLLDARLALDAWRESTTEGGGDV